MSFYSTSLSIAKTTGGTLLRSGGEASGKVDNRLQICHSRKGN